MIELKISLTILLCCLSLNLRAQNQLKLSPIIGKQSLLTYVSQESGDPTFDKLTFAFTNTFGLKGQWETGNGWQFFAGLTTTQTEIGYKYRGTRTVGKELRHRAFRFPIGIQRTISHHKIFPIKPSSILYGKDKNGRDKYLLLFRIRPLIGVSLDLRNHLPASVHSEDFGSSAFAGVTFQFFDQKKDRLSLALLYSHGFHKVATFPVAYTVDSQKYQAELASRGSLLAFQIGYPIALTGKRVP